MIDSSDMKRKHDRLAAFLNAFGLHSSSCDSIESANLLLLDADGEGSPTHLLYRPRSISRSVTPEVLTMATVSFNGRINPLIGALPEELCLNLKLEPKLQGLADIIFAERRDQRCGGGTIHARLCEVVVVLAIRKAIAAGTVDAGLLAGLAHIELHATLVAMHEHPTRRWRFTDLAAIAGMSRGRYIEVFKKTVGVSAGVYLTN